MLEIKSLGGLIFLVNGDNSTDIGSHKAQALIVYIAYENRPVNRNFLATFLWPESSQESASTSLRVALTALRKSFGDYLEITRDTVFFKPVAKWNFDLHELNTYLASGQIEKALAVYHGDFLTGFQIMDSPPFEAWQRGIQTQVNRKVVDVLQDLVDIGISTGDISAGLSHVNRLLAIDPLNEGGYQRCMLLYSLNNDIPSALAQYRICVKVLRNELGVTPSTETQSIYQKIIKGETPVDLSSKKRKIHLPVQRTNFVGRKIELFQVNKLLRDRNCRLLTLTGPGGVGKSRLASESAKLILDEFPEGVYFISFDGFINGDLIVLKIAEALGFTIDSIATPLSPENQLINFLRKKHVLLVLDGFDQLVTHGKVLSKILENAPGVKIMITSREKMDLMGEWIFTLPGLPVPEREDHASLFVNDSIRLFVSRVDQLTPGFHPSSEEYLYIADICSYIEGNPLGIELAASWSEVLTIEEIKKEILEDVDFLAAGIQDLPRGHQSLRAVFNSSWDLLSEKQQETLSCLSVFQDAFNRQAAQFVAQADIMQLSELVNKSLVVAGDQGRFSLHSLIRQFAQEKLSKKVDKQLEVENRYSHYYEDLLNRCKDDLMESDMLLARREIRQELTHVLAAMHWICLHGESASVLETLQVLLGFFAVHVWFEGVNFFAGLAKARKHYLERINLDPKFDPIVLACCVHQAFLLSNLGQIDESEAISRTCCKALGDLGLKAELSECWHNLGVNASFRGEYEASQSLLEDAIYLGKESDHILWPSYLLWLGHVYFLMGAYEDGMLTLNKCHAIFMKKGTYWGAAFALSKMGLASDGLGEHERAIRYHQSALDVFERVENYAGKGYCLSRMSISACHLGDYEQSKIYAEKGFQIFEVIDHHWGLSSALSCLGFAHYGLGNSQQACQAFCEALAISNRDQMAPLSLYALAGLALIMMERGQSAQAHSLLVYVKHHPKMAKAYFDHAFCVWQGKDLGQIDFEEFTVKMAQEKPSLEGIVEEILSMVCIKNKDFPELSTACDDGSDCHE